MPHANETIEIPVPPITERAALVQVVLPPQSEESALESMEELEQLAESAGAVTVAKIIQHRSRLEPSSVIGAGKLQNLKNLVTDQAVDVVIFDRELTPAQAAHLEDTLGCKVLDRTQLILDIFAQRAETREGKLQVELAQLQYLLPRLAGRGRIMRQQGGIGVRGPGEQKLEVDRRVIRKRIERLKSELEDVQRQRSQQRKKRTENSVGLVALVGYTNAGKSSLLRALTHADVYVADKLFATLDPRVRRCVLPSGRACLLADTVGFVRNLPHTLVAAFRATLEEVVRADLLLLVTDASHPSYTEHIQAVKAVLEEIGAAGIPRLLVFNKVDRLSEEAKASFRSTREPCVLVSALTGEGLDELRQNIDSFLEDKRRRVRLRIPQSRGDVLAQIYEETRPLEEKYEDNIVIIEAEVSPQLLGKVREFIG